MVSIQSSNSYQADPVYALPHLYISGLNVSVAGPTTMAIAPGQARDINNKIDMPVGFQNLQTVVFPPTLYQDYQPPILIDCTRNGVNGLDYGQLSAGRFYNVWLIASSTQALPTAGIVSLCSNVCPLLPEGYDSVRLVGFIGSNASSQFNTSFLRTASQLRAFYLTPNPTALASGNATTFTAVNLNSYIPTGSAPFVIVYFLATFIASNTGSYAQIIPTESTSTTPPTQNLPTIRGNYAGEVIQQYITIVAGTSPTQPSIDYLVSSASDSLTLQVAGYSYTTV